MDKERSVLDDVPIDDREWKFGKPVASPSGGESMPKVVLTIVAYCPSCSNPIYGEKSIYAGQEPKVVRTCSCSYRA